MYEQGSFEPVARIVQLASLIEKKRLADIAYETRRFVRIGESEETINQRIADNSKPLIYNTPRKLDQKIAANKIE